MNCRVVLHTQKDSSCKAIKFLGSIDEKLINYFDNYPYFLMNFWNKNGMNY